VTVTLHLGDCLDVMRGMPDACVDAVVTDPPYAATGTASSFVSRASKSSVPRETQFYEAWLREHLREWMRLVKPTGALWMTIDWRGAMSLDAACARLGARAPKVGVWYRRGLGMGFVLRNVYECFAVVPMEKFERQKTGEPDVWDHPWHPSDRTTGHSAEKPLALMVRACALVSPPGGVIFDPFMGSGSCGLAAVTTGRSFIGIEREPEYFSIAEARIAHARGETPANTEQPALPFEVSA